jgi:hypothetical protein
VAVVGDNIMSAEWNAYRDLVAALRERGVVTDDDCKAPHNSPGTTKGLELFRLVIAWGEAKGRLAVAQAAADELSRKELGGSRPRRKIEKPFKLLIYRPRSRKEGGPLYLFKKKAFSSRANMDAGFERAVNDHRLERGDKVEGWETLNGALRRPVLSYTATGKEGGR